MKPEFDPSQPFEAVAAKPPFDPSKPFEAAPTAEPAAAPKRENPARLTGQLMEGMPVVGPLMHKASAAVGAGIQALTGSGNDKSFGDRYSENLARETGDAENYRKEHPVASGAARVAGGAMALAPAAAAAPTAFGLAGPSMVGRMAAGGVTNAAIGGADAALSGEDIPTGVATGGALGAAAAPVGAGVSKATEGLIGLFNKPKYAGAATSRIERAVADDKLTPQDLQAKAAELGPEGTLADMGRNLKGQAGAVAAQPGPGQNVMDTAMRTRAEGAGQRVTDTLDTHMGTAVQPLETVDQIVARRKALADPLYEAVKPNPVTMTPTMVELSQRPGVKSAIAKAIRMSDNEGIPFGSDVRSWDLVKRALDDVQNGYLGKGARNGARVVGGARDALVAELDKQHPDYAKARDAFRGESQIKEAFENGRTLFDRNVSPEEVNRALAGMSAGERDAHVQGARSGIADIMGAARNDATAARARLSTNWNQEKLRAVLGPAADPIIQAADREAAFAGTNQAVSQNSLTATRDAAKKEFPSAVDKTPLPHMTLTDIPVAAARKVGNVATSMFTKGRNERVGEDAARVLSASGRERDDAIAAIGDAVRGRRRNAAIGSAAGRAASIGVDTQD